MKDLRKEVDELRRTLNDERNEWGVRESDYIIQIQTASQKKSGHGLNV